MAKTTEITTGPVQTSEEQRRALEALVRKLNEVIRALNELLPS